MECVDGVRAAAGLRPGSRVSPRGWGVAGWRPGAPGREGDPPPVRGFSFPFFFTAILAFSRHQELKSAMHLYLWEMVSFKSLKQKHS